jgi:hypothetical protein
MAQGTWNLKQGHLEKSKLVQHAFEESHQVCWDKAKFLQMKPNRRYRKYKKSVHMVYFGKNHQPT